MAGSCWRYKVTDDQFLAAFEACAIRNQDFHHEDHVRIAFVYLCRFPLLEAMQRFSQALKAFAAHNGRPDRYHETITWAFLFLIGERMARASQQNGSHSSWEEFAVNNPDLLNWEDNILKKYYRSETLASSLARSTFVFPDRIAASE